MNLSLSDHEDSYSAYSDDFENESQASHRYLPGNKRKVSSQHSGLESEVTSSSFISNRSPKKFGAGIRKKKDHKFSSSTLKENWKTSASSTGSKRRPSIKNDTVQARLMSAQRNKINTLGNELGEIRVKYDQVTKENRLLKTLQHRHEKSLRQFQDTEGDLPRLIAQHMEDERVLKARLRKSQEAERITEAKLKESNDEILRMQTTLRRLKKLIFDKNLGERSELAKQLAAAEDQLIGSERTKMELEKKLHLTKQSYSRQLRTEQLKHKETKAELTALQKKFTTVHNKLKEKERALEVSNIYALRTKNSAEKSFFGNKLAIANQLEEKPSPSTPRKETPMLLGEPAKPIEEAESFSVAPAPNVVAATSEVKDHRKTIRTPLKTTPKKAKREKSELLDLGQPKTDQVISQFNELELQQPVKREASFLNQIEKDKAHHSVFITSTYSPNSTFISDRASPKTAAVADEPTQASPAPPEKVDYAAQLKAGMKLEEERQKMEEERKKKAALLAKMKDLEEEDNVISSNKSDSEDLRKLLNTNPKPIHKPLVRIEKPPKDSDLDQLFEVAETDRKSPRRNLVKKYGLVTPFEKTFLDQLDDDISYASGSSSGSPTERRRTPRIHSFVENLHAGVPSTTKSNSFTTEPDEPEITFGGYAPTVAAPPKRIPSNQIKKKPFSPSDSEADEPLLDLESGKMSKKNDFLAQLFGDQPSKPETNGLVSKENSFTSARGAYGAKTTPRAKPIHSGYPWERDVVAATSGHSGNGDAREKMTISPAVKAIPSFNDDDIEEVTL